MRTYILYDSRACDGMGTSNASVLVVCESDAEAQRDADDYGACACYSYEDKGGKLTDERFEWNHFDD